MNDRHTTQCMIKEHRRWDTLLASLFLVVATWLLYGAACSSWWHYDDAAHLWFVIRHTHIWQYFALPEVSRAFSEASLVPWGALFYRLVYICCGMEHPGGAYAVQLLALFAAAWMTRTLLGLWVRPIWAWLGALLFLLGAPAMHVAYELMTVHYIQGLLFALIAAYGFVRALRDGTWWPAVAGGVGYLLAVTAKEIYVPLPILLLFLPENTWKQRGRKALPFLLVLAAYPLWRWFMLDTLIGGYQAHAGVPDIAHICRSLLNIPIMLVGAGGLGWSLLIGGSIGIVWLIGWNWRKILFTFLFLGAVLGPMAPLTLFPGLDSPNRYLLIAWWGMTTVCVLVMDRLSDGSRRRTWIALALWLAISLAAAHAMRQEQGRTQSWIDRYEIQGQFLWSSASDRIFVIRPPFHVARFVTAIKREIAGKSSAPIVIDDQADLEIQTRLGLVPAEAYSNASVWAYNESDRRMEDITAEFHSQIESQTQTRDRARVREAALQIDLQFEKSAVQWRLGPYAQGKYLMVRLADGGVIDRVRFAPQGRRDATGAGQFDFFMRYDSPEGWTTYSPVLHFDRKKGNVIWQRD